MIRESKSYYLCCDECGMDVEDPETGRIIFNEKYKAEAFVKELVEEHGEGWVLVAGRLLCSGCYEEGK